MMKKRMLSIVLAMALFQCLVPVTALANESDDAEESPGVAASSEIVQIVEDETQTYIPAADDLPDNDELFAMYAMNVFYGNNGIMLLSDYGDDRLSGTDLKIYTALKAKIEEVASGQVSSTQFTLTWAEMGIQTTWTKDELGVTEILVYDSETSSPKFSEEATAAISEKIAFDWSTIVDCLLVDCPYELYWFDKTAGTTCTGGGYSGTSDTITLTGEKTFSFSVSQDYAISSYVTNTVRTQAASAAMVNAQSIVDQYADASDYEKLVGYKNEICNLVSYNDDAADSSTNTSYGDPWQLIYVFDGDADTNVVCEGYSKAFQYLCDLTTFDGDVICYTVSGNMSGGTGAGGHMWNIVTMNDGDNYLVDVTNSDTGSVGQNGGLFLVGNSTGSVDSGYSFTIGTQTISYKYDSDTTSLYSSGILTLSATNYPQPVTIEQAPTATATYGQTLSEVSLTGGEVVDSGGNKVAGTWAWADAAQSVGDVGENASLAVFTPSDTSSYQTVEDISVKVTVSPKTLTDVTIDGIADQAYTGSEITPSVTVTSNSLVSGDTLALNTDYTVAYSNNTAVGTATVTVSPVSGSNYTFTEKTTTFEITNEITSITVTGLTAPVKGGTPDTSVTLTETGITAGTVAWYEGASGGNELTGSFAANTVYRVEISYTLESGYSVSGSTSVTAANSTSATVDVTNSEIVIVYPATADKDALGGTVNIVGDPIFKDTLI